ncbi:glucokinase [Lysobacter niabensis]|uniref:Glucokinase n=1 Tax=Agrilutibacter niabensis TaxID=380628 RepID=A0ABU1VR55_9GAMM|nr:glucokinase [Lysobacter niabensis]MDR7099979.1 glucokinase [Lysobacter niabensis]
MKADSRPLALIADVGGTNARFALTDPASSKADIIEPRSLINAEFASLQHAAEHYLAEVGAHPRSAAIAVASPVHGEEIRLTNRAWSFTRSELKQALGLHQLSVINDFGAVSWAIPALQSAEYLTLHGRDDAPLRGPVSVIGPGTGLGVALLVGDAQRGWDVVETEGGHVSFAPLGDEEQTIARWLTARFGRTSTERVLCGAGLSHIDAVLRSNGNAPHDVALRGFEMREPADIVKAALEGHDVVARRALARFCAVLGSVCGDTALIHGARTVMIAGGMVPRFIPFLRSSAFRERFLAKGRFAPYLESVTIRVITHPNPGLLGAAVAARAALQAEASR